MHSALSTFPGGWSETNRMRTHPPDVEASLDRHGRQSARAYTARKFPRGDMIPISKIHCSHWRELAEPRSMYQTSGATHRMPSRNIL